ncbi:hypothetical protein GOV05_04930 [Candidatus Woesearchaeota archaeon]|nr:hypothetical protein [Candidatus Woesearchaeota archaeon]
MRLTAILTAATLSLGVSSLTTQKAFAKEDIYKTVNVYNISEVDAMLNMVIPEARLYELSFKWGGYNRDFENLNNQEVYNKFLGLGVILTQRFRKINEDYRDSKRVFNSINGVKPKEVVTYLEGWFKKYGVLLYEFGETIQEIERLNKEKTHNISIEELIIGRNQFEKRLRLDNKYINDLLSELENTLTPK